MLPKKSSKYSKGQGLIGILIALAIFSILSQAIFTVAATSFNLVSFNRARITARHLAQEKLELIRNLPYDQVGTAGGIPPGPLPQEETVVRNKLSYKVKTTIIYIDDPFDQTAPNDLLATDYKRVRVEVSWEGISGGSRNNPVVLISDIAPKGVETTAGGGTLSIVVFDADGDPVPQAEVSIIANDTNPPVNLNLQTADNGRVILPGAPTCVSCYQITATKSGYSSERTYSTSEVANPSKPHQTILEGQLTEISFSIDRVSTLTISTFKGREDNFESLPNFSFNFWGQKTIGTDTNGQPVYKYNKTLISDSDGNLTLNNLEWDVYQATPSAATYDISGTNPLQPTSILPNTSTTFKIAFSPHSTNSLLLAFTDPTNNPIASVSATLTDGISYNETKFTGTSTDPDFGQVFFSNLIAKTYTLTATASGYLDFTTSINVDGNSQERFVLTPQ